MDSLSYTLAGMMSGFDVALQPMNLLWAFVGCLLGTAVGVLPGIGPAVTIALLLPLTGQLDATSALIMFAGVYYGAMYGGSTASILLNTPGESATIVTAMEGHHMAKRGKAGPALATAAIGSFVAGTLATMGVVLLSPLVVEVALKFGPAEYFALMVLAFVTVSVALGASSLRGLTSLVAGLALGVVGTEALTGQARYAFGVPHLLDGIDVVLVAVGMFAVGETLYAAVYERRQPAEVSNLDGRVAMNREDWRRSWPAWLRGSLIGFPFGTIPAGGAEIPTFLSYAVEKKLSKKPEEFGKGAIEGVAGPEAANNASVTGALVPLLTLGLPTSATAAVILSAFTNYGIQPGPMLFDTQPELVWGLIASLYVGNVVLLALNLPLARVWAKLLFIPRHWLYAGILVFATLGAYGLRQSVFDLFLLYGLGLVSMLMRRYHYPTAPVLIGLILGPMAEVQLRRALSISQGDPMVFAQHPISASIFAIVLAVLIVPPVLRMMRKPAQ